MIPDQFIKVAESGISQPESIEILRGHGFQGFLIGEAFMKAENPGQAIADFIAASRWLFFLKRWFYFFLNADERWFKLIYADFLFAIFFLYKYTSIKKIRKSAKSL